MNNYFVYTWTRPDTGEVFYIGKGKGKRDKDLKRNNRYFMHIVAKLEREGLAPKVERIADGLTEQEAFDIERAEIARHGRLDMGMGTLVNLTDGGEGQSGYVPSKETVARHAAMLREKYDDPEYREKHSAAARKAWDDENRRGMMSAKFKEKWEDPKYREKLVAAHRHQGPHKGNSSGFKGVSIQRRDGGWRASISVDGKRPNLGAHPTAEAAARAYDAFAFATWGVDCYLNFPDEHITAANDNSVSDAKSVGRKSG